MNEAYGSTVIVIPTPTDRHSISFSEVRSALKAISWQIASLHYVNVTGPLASIRTIIFQYTSYLYFSVLGGLNWQVMDAALRQHHKYSIYSLYWHKSANTGAVTTVNVPVLQGGSREALDAEAAERLIVCWMYISMYISPCTNIYTNISTCLI